MNKNKCNKAYIPMGIDDRCTHIKHIIPMCFSQFNNPGLSPSKRFNVLKMQQRNKNNPSNNTEVE